MPDSVALTALVVSLVALFTTIGQLLQQYLATADGFRRCQPSVMGLWARRTKLRWRWREFRFETMFVVPRIKYGPLHPDAGKYSEISSGSCSMISTEESLKGSMVYPGWGSLDARQYYDSDQLACWVPLLAQLHMQGANAAYYFPQKPDSMENDTMVPLVQFIEKSWDFMPTDIVRPMASSTVYDIAIMARRLGMVWKNFDPGSGSMRAEGNGHIFTSTMARSLGTVLQYTYTSRKNDGNCAYVPVREADKLGFGLVEFDHRLFGPEMGFDLDVGSYEGIARTFPRFVTKNRYHRYSKRTNENMNLKCVLNAVREKRDFIPGLNDMVPICSAMLSTSDNSAGLPPWTVRIPSPNTLMKGVTSSAEGFRVFRNRLEALISSANSASDQAKNILQCLQTIQEMSNGLWEFEDDWDASSHDQRPAVRSSARASKNLVRQYHTDATTFLRNSSVNYHDLALSHLLYATHQLSDEYQNNTEVEEYGLMGDRDLLRSIHSYFDKLPSLIADVLLKSGQDKPLADDVQDAWLTMMFRAFCWQRSHVMILEIPPLPSEYWNSKMPVYIG